MHFNSGYIIIKLHLKCAITFLQHTKHILLWFKVAYTIHANWVFILININNVL